MILPVVSSRTIKVSPLSTRESVTMGARYGSSGRVSNEILDGIPGKLAPGQAMENL
jgi:hypothetical protein